MMQPGSNSFSRLIGILTRPQEHTHPVITFIRTYWTNLFILAILLLCSLYFAYKTFSGWSSPQAANDVPRVEYRQNPEGVIYVDLSGAVSRPDTYKVMKGTRLFQLIEQAGGLSPVADNGFVQRNYNFSVILTDQQKIHIPSVYEVNDGYFTETRRHVTLGADPPTLGSVVGSEESSATKISINSASSRELESLPGVGSVTAERIIAARPFDKLEDLITDGIVKQSVYAEIADLIEL